MGGSVPGGPIHPLIILRKANMSDLRPIGGGPRAVGGPLPGGPAKQRNHCNMNDFEEDTYGPSAAVLGEEEVLVEVDSELLFEN